jgi:hypothetical protein
MGPEGGQYSITVKNNGGDTASLCGVLIDYQNSNGSLIGRDQLTEYGGVRILPGHSWSTTFIGETDESGVPITSATGIGSACG